MRSPRPAWSSATPTNQDRAGQARRAGLQRQLVRQAGDTTRDTARTPEGQARERAERQLLAQPVTGEHIDVAPTQPIRDLLVSAAAAQQTLSWLREHHHDTALDASGAYLDYHDWPRPVPDSLRPPMSPDDAQSAAIEDVRDRLQDRYDNSHRSLVWDAEDRANSRSNLATAAATTAADPAGSSSRTGDRWLGIVETVAGRDLRRDEGWSMLSDMLDRAEAAGWAVPDRLPEVAAQVAANGTGAHDLAYQVMDACPGAIPAPPAISELNGQPPQSLGRAREAAEAAILRPQQPPERGRVASR